MNSFSAENILAHFKLEKANSTDHLLQQVVAKLGLDQSGSSSSEVKDAYASGSSDNAGTADYMYLKSRAESNFAKINREFARQNTLVTQMKQELDLQRKENAIIKK